MRNKQSTTRVAAHIGMSFADNGAAFADLLNGLGTVTGDNSTACSFFLTFRDGLSPEGRLLVAELAIAAGLFRSIDDASRVPGARDRSGAGRH